MAKITLPTIASGFASNTSFNTAFDAIEAEFQNKVLYRNNTSGETNTMSNALDMNSNAITNASSVTTTALVVSGVDIAASVTASGASATAAAASAVAAGTSATAAATSASAASAASVGIKWKNSVKCATTANITLSGVQPIDGISATEESRVLVMDQTDAEDNGIYIAAAGAWARSSDLNVAAAFPSATVMVESGSVNADKAFICIVDQGLTLDTTDLIWAEFGTVSATNIVDDLSPQLGGFLDPNDQYIGMEKKTLTAASPCVVPETGDYIVVSGTTSFTQITTALNRHFFLQFEAALTMTHHATNLDLPGGANITTAAGDVAEFVSTGTNQVQCVNYTKADGTAVVSSAGGGPSKGANASIRTNAANIQESIALSDHSATFTTTHGSNLIANRGSSDNFVDGDMVMVSSAGTIPPGYVAGTQYFVRDITSTTMKLSTAHDGAVQAISGDGSGTHTIYQNINGMSAGPITISSGTTTIPAGSTWSII
jgi:hypothetical protein